MHRAFYCAQSFFQCRAQSFGGQSLSSPTNAFAAGNSCFTNSRVQKLKNSAKPNSGTVRRFSPMKPAVCGFGSRLLRSQGFIGAKAPLDPLCRFFVAQSFVLAAFATLVCQRNCVFLCKGTKLKIFMPSFCGAETDYCKKNRRASIQKYFLFDSNC